MMYFIEKYNVGCVSMQVISWKELAPARCLILHIILEEIVNDLRVRPQIHLACLIHNLADWYAAIY